MTTPAAPEPSRGPNGPKIALRPARQEEQHLISAFVRKEHLNPLSLDWRHFWLAESDNGEIVACGQIKPHGDGSRELASLVVLPAWRGKGVAGTLIGKLKSEAGKPLWLTCRSGLIPFYNRFGFVDVTLSDDLPPYFRRIRRLAGAFMRLAGRDHRLAIMLWPVEQDLDRSLP